MPLKQKEASRSKFAGGVQRAPHWYQYRQQQGSLRALAFLLLIRFYRRHHLACITCAQERRDAGSTLASASTTPEEEGALSVLLLIRLEGGFAWLGLAVFINWQVGCCMVCFCKPSTLDALKVSAEMHNNFQNLFLENIHLVDDNKQLIEYGVVDGSDLVLKPIAPQ